MKHAYALAVGWISPMIPFSPDSTIGPQSSSNESRSLRPLKSTLRLVREIEIAPCISLTVKGRLEVARIDKINAAR